MKKRLIVACCVLVFVLSACAGTSGSSSQSSSMTEDASLDTGSQDIGNGRTVEKSANNTSTPETKEVSIDGVWKLDHIEGVTDQALYDQLIESDADICYVISNEYLYPFIENRGIAKYSNLELEETNSQESPVDIGYCNKYKINTVDGVETAFFSEDSWITSVKQKSGETANFVYKKLSLTRSGELYRDEENKALFSGSTKEFSIDGVSFRVPSTWEEFENTTDSQKIFYPTGDSSEYIVDFEVANNQAISSGSKEDMIGAAKVYFADDSLYTDVTEPEITSFKGYYCVEANAKSVRGYICKVRVLKISAEHAVIFGVLRREGIKELVQDEEALIYSIKDLLSVEGNTDARQHQSLQTCNQDSQKDFEISFTGADVSEGNGGMQLVKKHKDSQNGKFDVNLYYGRSESVDPINIRFDFMTNGIKTSGSPHSIGLGEEIHGETIGITNENAGIWVIRVVNNDSEEVLAEKIIETSLENGKSDDAGDSTFTNAYGTPTTKCAHPGCNNTIAPSGDTNCCTVHSNRCADCGKYIDEDAMYCMDCLNKAANPNIGAGGYEMPNESDKSFSDYVKRVDPDLYNDIFSE